MPPRLPLPLRNALAELLLDSLDVDADARATRDTAVIAIALLVTYDQLATGAAPVVDLCRLHAASAPGTAMIARESLHKGVSKREARAAASARSGARSRISMIRRGLRDAVDRGWIALRRPKPPGQRLPGIDDRGLARLRETLMTDASSPGGGRAICLRPDFLPWLPAVGDHARRYRAVLDVAVSLRVCQAPGLSGVIARGAVLFNAGLFYEVHEMLEGAWRTAAGDEKTFLQGMVQIAVALYHHGQGNHRGARSLLRAGYDKVDAARAAAPPVIDLDGLLAALAPWQAFLDSSTGEFPPATPAPPLPRCLVLTSERAGHPISE